MRTLKDHAHEVLAVDHDVMIIPVLGHGCRYSDHQALFNEGLAEWFIDIDGQVGSNLTAHSLIPVHQEILHDLGFFNDEFAFLVLLLLFVSVYLQHRTVQGLHHFRHDTSVWV